MRSDVKSELQESRELVWFFLYDKSCYFCNGLLCLPPNDPNQVVPSLTWGHRHHNRFLEDVTLHHIDENREHNDRSNIGVCHSSCHKRYHAARRAALRNEVIKRVNTETSNT